MILTPLCLIHLFLQLIYLLQFSLPTVLSSHLIFPPPSDIATDVELLLWEILFAQHIIELIHGRGHNIFLLQNNAFTHHKIFQKSYEWPPLYSVESRPLSPVSHPCSCECRHIWSLRTESRTWIRGWTLTPSCWSPSPGPGSCPPACPSRGSRREWCWGLRDRDWLKKRVSVKVF